MSEQANRVERYSTNHVIYIHGAIITPRGFIPSGTVVIEDDSIRSVLPVRTHSEGRAVEIESDSIICPGFVDTHNHAEYAVFPRWPPEQSRFRGRFEWRGKTRCSTTVISHRRGYYASNIAKQFRALTTEPSAVNTLAWYGQLRGLIGGATTMVLDTSRDACTLMRVARVGQSRVSTPTRLWSIIDSECVGLGNVADVRDDVTNGTGKVFVHVGEGFDDFSKSEFALLTSHNLVTEHTALIHAIALSASEWRIVREKQTALIWSPSSNFHLYGRSLDITTVLNAGIPVALAPDWTLTGGPTMLDELRFVRQRYGWICPEDLLNMVTAIPADLLGMPRLGRIEEGALADLVLFPTNSATSRRAAVENVVSSSHSDIRLTIVGGISRYGIASLMEQFPQGDSMLETIRVPLSDGASASRVVRLPDDESFALSIDRIALMLLPLRLTIAPLWEPPML